MRAECVFFVPVPKCTSCARSFSSVSYYSFIHIVCPIELPAVIMNTQLSTTVVWFSTQTHQIIRRI